MIYLEKSTYSGNIGCFSINEVVSSMFLCVFVDQSSTDMRKGVDLPCIVLGGRYGCLSESIVQGRSYYQMNIDISDCFFSRCSVYSGDGGVIYVSGGSYSMIVNSSMFYNCMATNYGAIYYYSANSIIKMICANSCSCVSNNQCNFAHIEVSQVNEMEYLSISNCSHATTASVTFFH